jgi:hypothetical protein
VSHNRKAITVRLNLKEQAALRQLMKFVNAANESLAIKGCFLSAIGAMNEAIKRMKDQQPTAKETTNGQASNETGAVEPAATSEGDGVPVG